MSAVQTADGLKLFIDNDGDLYTRQTTSILKNLATKKARGAYKHDLAVKLFGYLVEAGAKKYAKEFGSPADAWHRMFPVVARTAVAEALTRDFEGEYALGNYDHLLPRKYQAQLASTLSSKELQARGRGDHARKKITWRVPEGLDVEWSPVNQAYFAMWGSTTQRQQVLKIADADEMDAWLRDTYGPAYGRGGSSGGRPGARLQPLVKVPKSGGRASHSQRKTSLAVHESMHDPKVLRASSDRQLRGFYRDEKQDVAMARAEGARRGVALHARKKGPAQLDREIAAHVPSWRGRGR